MVLAGAGTLRTPLKIPRAFESHHVTFSRKTEVALTPRGVLFNKVLDRHNAEPNIKYTTEYSIQEVKGEYLGMTGAE